MKTDNPYELHADSYEAWFDKYSYAYQSELAAVRMQLPKGSGIEIGVGTGRFAGPLGIPFGVEPCLAMADYAGASGVQIIRAVSESLPIKSRTFDFVLFVTVLCFVQDIPKTLAEANRILKPRGSLVIAFINRSSTLGTNYDAHKKQSVFYTNANFYTAEEINRFMIDTGCSNLKHVQTIFNDPLRMDKQDDTLPGSDKGAFIVARGIKF
ncbi:MAG: class I SAM-dependent methyltransferase [Proteobacteria bacterium]|nr:class I SAM-dependent methyltransferase [Pseudomonadota bacterium]MBU1709297.1 class I SAM-dependent methyltransferase [Pseudomonadota bacterium]